MKKLNQNGALHIMIMGSIAIVITAGIFAYWRVSESNKKTLNTANSINQSEQIETLPQNLDSLKTLDEVGQIAGVSDDISIIKFALENKDGAYIYKIVLSNGKVLEIDASTGKILKEETTDVSNDDKIPTGVKVNISPTKAYALAAQKSSSPVKSMEMEVEDKKVVYKIEFKDGSKVEIDATSGEFVKSEIKDEDKEDKEDKTEDHKDEDKEDKTEDHKDEDKEDETEDR